MSPVKVYNEAFRLAVEPAFDFARTQEVKIEPMNAPSPVPAKVSDKEMVIDFLFDLRPEIEIGAYTGITTVEKPNITVSDEEVDKTIDTYCEQFAMEKEKGQDAKIAKGDIVTFDFKGYVNDEAFRGGEAKGYTLVIGSNQFVPGFEDSMIGLGIGSDQAINVKFPETYVPELAGKDAKFVLNITDIKERIIPAKDDELAADLNMPEIKTFEDLKVKVREDLAVAKERNAKALFAEEVTKEIIKGSKIELPKSVIERQKLDIKKQFEDQLSKQGVTLKEYKEVTGITDEQIEEELLKDAKLRLQTFLVNAEIKNKEKFAITDEMVNEKLESLAKQYGVEVEYIKSAISTDAIKEEISSEMLTNFLFEKNGK